MTNAETPIAPTSADSDDWVSRFHAGQRDVMEQCYRDFVDAVEGTVKRILRDADRETVVHEVFLRLLTRPEMRRNFTGGSFCAWISTVARNHALDHARRQKLERLASADLRDTSDEGETEGLERKVEARLLVERFRRESLPERLWPVFHARFVEQLDQREAARRTGLRRTTLAYQEFLIRRLLAKFILGGESA